MAEKAAKIFLEICGLGLCIGNQWILEDLDLDIRKQENGQSVAQTEPGRPGFHERASGGRAVVPVIDRRYPLSEVPEALRYYGEGHAQGKVVIAFKKE